MEKVFLAKILNDDDRDVVKYIDFEGFECGHYFSGLHICGACFYGFEKEFRDEIENNFENLETILTKEEYEQMFAINDELKALGYGIEENSEKYQKGMELINKFEETIGKRLLSEENEELFKKVVADEKEFVKNEHNLTDDEVDELFENYGLDYQDRAIIGNVFDDLYDLVEEEKWSLGYDKYPYFDDEKFGRDLLDSEYYYELENGRIASYCY